MEHQIFEVGATRANHFSFFNWGANRFLGADWGEGGRRKLEMSVDACRAF